MSEPCVAKTAHESSSAPASCEAEQRERDAVIAEALTWLKTPYHHMGRIKGEHGGVDCAQIVALTYHSALPHRITAVPLEYYPPDWMFHRDLERYLTIVTQHAREIETPKPGDVVLWKIGRVFAHGAIVLPPGWPHIIHSDMNAKRVETGDGRQGRLAGRDKKFFTLW